MSQATNMGLSFLTRLLLWLLEKRPDVGNLSVQDPQTMDCLQDLSNDEIYGDLTPEQILQFDQDYLEGCIPTRPPTPCLTRFLLNKLSSSSWNQRSTISAIKFKTVSNLVS